jgi:signal transduction histidine kinase
VDKKSRFRVPRRLLIASVVLGLFVFLDLGLLGWLIFRSLSEREVQRALTETRQEAEGLAERLEGRAILEGEDLYTATAKEREIQTYIDSILKQKQLVQSVEVRDREGKLVFRGDVEAKFELEPESGPRIESGEVPTRVEDTREATYSVGLPIESLYNLDVPIGELGFLHVGISQEEMQRRTETLRSELVQKISLVGVVTIFVLLLAYLIIWGLWRRGRRLEEQALEAEKMAYIGTLASGLAHEIRNPLNSLNLNMQLLEEEMGGALSNGSNRRLMSITRSEIGRLERLVTDFLSYAKPSPLELEILPAVTLLERCRELMAEELRSLGARLSIEDRSDGGCVEVDPGQISQLLLNLVHNALLAIEESGREPEVQLSVHREGARVVLEVRDRGVGIPRGELNRIFDLFYSTRKGGTGLGLAVVQRIAQNHGGEVEVQSVVGEGTAVRVLLPSAKPQDEAIGSRSAVELSGQAQP